MKRWLDALDRHWFAPASLRDLAIARIVIVGAQLVFFLPDLEWQLTLVREAAPSLYVPLPALKVLLLPLAEWGARPDPMVLQAAWGLAVISGITGVLGLYTRPSLLLFAATNTLLTAHTWSYGDLHHPEGLLVIALWLLALGPSGESLSLDDLRRRIYASVRFMRFAPATAEEDRSAFARWPLRTIQWLFVLTYLSAGMSKVVIGGLDWFNGHTLAYYFIQDGVRFGNGLGLQLAQYTALASMMSVGAVALELSFVLAIFVPALTGPYVLAGSAMHTTIYIIQKAPFFQFIVLYIAFIESLRRSVPRFRRSAAPAASWKVVYDGRCPVCVRSMVILDYFDFRRRLEYLDLEEDWMRATRIIDGATRDEVRRAMHVVDDRGRIHRGFFAFRELARVLPALWIALPFLYAPFAAVIGPRIYTWVAHRRARIECDRNTCATI